MSRGDYAVLFATLRTALLNENFRTNTDMRNRVALRITNTYRGAPVVPPKLDDVIDETLAEVCADLRQEADALARCEKVDSCRAKAVVLGQLAEFLVVQS